MNNQVNPRPAPGKVKQCNVVYGSNSDSEEIDEVQSSSPGKPEEVSNGRAAESRIKDDEVGASCTAETNAINNDEIEEFNIPARTLPSYNVPEKIIIVYDSAVDEISTEFSVNNESICPTLMLKRSIRLFLQNKRLIDPRHEFALVSLNDNGCVWQHDFTKDIDDIIDALETVPESSTEDILKLDELFKLISNKVQLPCNNENMTIPPPFVVRVLFTYGRSFTMPEVNAKSIAVETLIKSPYFTFDILMTHEMPNARNNCIKIFKYLQMIDCKGFAYFFPVGRSAAELHFSMAKLLAHPLQRPCQRAADYTINAMET